MHAAAGFLYGLAEQYVAEITFTNVDISMAENATPGHPDMMAGVEDMQRRGFYLGNVRDVQFHQVTIADHEGPAFYIENGEAVELLHCQSRNTGAPGQLESRVTISAADLNAGGQAEVYE
ncbi:hypothetical protein D3C75_933310 [compost metagenome]